MTRRYKGFVVLAVLLLCLLSPKILFGEHGIAGQNTEKRLRDNHQHREGFYDPDPLRERNNAMDMRAGDKTCYDFSGKGVDRESNTVSTSTGAWKMENPAMRNGNFPLPSIGIILID